MIRATKLIDGFGVLSERSAEDVLSLAAYAKKSKGEGMSDLIICATTISQSLKYNYDNIVRQSLALKWYMLKKFQQKRALKKEIKRLGLLVKPNYLLAIFSQGQIYELYAEALLLEGIDVKKKVAEVLKESAELPAIV